MDTRNNFSFKENIPLNKNKYFIKLTYSNIIIKIFKEKKEKN